MPVDLTTTLAWHSADGSAAAMLNELQANILHSHVRDHMEVLFFRFASPSGGRRFLRAVAPLVKSAATHLRELEAYAGSRLKGTVYVGVGLSNEGYDAIGVPLTARPDDDSFRAGMRDASSVDRLCDPPVIDWDGLYRDTIHAIVLVADKTESSVAAAVEQILAVRSYDVRLVGREQGLGVKNDQGRDVEHFGFVDGISEPLFLDEDVRKAGYTTWGPEVALGEVITQDPGVPRPPGRSKIFFGSYLVFRKLEQNVRAFKEAELEVAAALRLAGDHEQRAGALLVGRFEDGTPLVLSETAGQSESMDDFSYALDPHGARCPFDAHIRKMNGRRTGDADRPDRPLARRGQSFGLRRDKPSDRNVAVDRRPEREVGLLFMSVNSTVGEHFVVVQSDIANSPGFDPLIGQGGEPSPRSYAETWDNPSPQVEVGAFPSVVTMKGGEYFFLPSLAFLRNPDVAIPEAT